MENHELASIFTVDVKLKEGSDLEEVNSIIDSEMARFLEKGPSQDELDRVITQANATLIRGLVKIGGFSGKAAASWLGPGRYQLDVLPYGDYKTTAAQVDRSKGLPAVGALPDLAFPEI